MALDEAALQSAREAWAKTPQVAKAKFRQHGSLLFKWREDLEDKKPAAGAGDSIMS